jgi:hypothetical protein
MLSDPGKHFFPASKKEEADSGESAPELSRVKVVGLLAEVDADVEAAVVPIRLVVATPLPVAFHSLNVASNLLALVSEAVRIAVDSGAIRF